MRALAAVLVTALVVSWAVPALSTPTASSSASKLSKRVKRLERRVNALARLTLDAHSRTYVRDSYLGSTGNGFYRGSTSCDPGDEMTGGGASNGYVLESAPNLAGWSATVEAAPGDLPRVYVVCAY